LLLGKEKCGAVFVTRIAINGPAVGVAKLAVDRLGNEVFAVGLRIVGESFDKFDRLRFFLIAGRRDTASNSLSTKFPLSARPGPLPDRLSWVNASRRIAEMPRISVWVTIS
jgi:hypothetical protein